MSYTDSVHNQNRLGTIWYGFGTIWYIFGMDLVRIWYGFGYGFGTHLVWFGLFWSDWEQVSCNVVRFRTDAA